MYNPNINNKSILEIETFLRSDRVKSLDKLNVSVLRNVSMEFFEPFLRYTLVLNGLDCGIRFGSYDSVVQDALDDSGDLLTNETDVVLVFTPIIALSPMIEKTFTSLSEAQINDEVERLESIFFTVCKGIRQQTNAPILWAGLEPQIFANNGIMDSQKENGQNGTIGKLNNTLRRALNSFDSAFYVDIAGCLSRVGSNNFYDLRNWEILRCPYSKDGFLEIAREFSKYIMSVFGRTKKCLVLDCDNTLWGGIIGEDGLSGIALGNTFPGSAFVDFQKEILSLYRRGVILAVCSKNNFSDVEEVFRDHPEMILKTEHITSWEVNWENKATNIVKIAKTVNIGLDSIVFMDDSEFETELVREKLPEVRTILVPKDKPFQYRWILSALGAFDNTISTNEDKLRTKFYSQDRIRKKMLSADMDLDGYCLSLETELTIGSVNEENLPRISQQTQKTNQFNLTTYRYSEADIRQLITKFSADIYWVSAKDKFGDMGIIGTCILKYEDKNAYIDTFLLSCRALGRRIEDKFLEEICYLAHRKGVKTIIGDYIPTPKNQQVKTFYKRNGFTRDNTVKESVFRYEFKLDRLKGRSLGVFKNINLSLKKTSLLKNI